MAADDDAPTETSPVELTVLTVTPMRAGRFFALAPIEIGLGGVAFELHGIRAVRVRAAGTRIELMRFGDAGGEEHAVVKLPPEISDRISDAALDALIGCGLAQTPLGWRQDNLIPLDPDQR
jgi:hypothetical protein